MKKNSPTFRGFYIPGKRYYYGVERAYDYMTDCLKTGDTIPATSFGAMLIDEDWIVEEFTGIKDKNGVEIYEGDFIGIANNAVEFSFGCWNVNGDIPLDRFVDPIVVGNINGGNNEK